MDSLHLGCIKETQTPVKMLLLGMFVRVSPEATDSSGNRQREEDPPPPHLG